MTKLLFVCHGNICRSPMAEFIMKDLVEKAGLKDRFHIESAATSTEELGNPVYPPVRRKLAEHGIGCSGKTARQLQKGDYAAFDLLLGMDRANLRNMERICGGDQSGKIHALLEYTGRTAAGSPAGPTALPGRDARKHSMFSTQAETEKRRLRFNEVADPWYTGDFETAYQDILAGCQGLLSALTEG